LLEDLHLLNTWLIGWNFFLWKLYLVENPAFCSLYNWEVQAIYFVLEPLESSVAVILGIRVLEGCGLSSAYFSWFFLFLSCWSCNTFRVWWLPVYSGTTLELWRSICSFFLYILARARRARLWYEFSIMLTYTRLSFFVYFFIYFE
jgi:hypothetical protein